MTTDKLTLTAKVALAALTDAVVFASEDAMRPILHAVRITANGGRCQLVGCDSYVLGTFTFDAEGTMTALIAIDDVKRIVALAKAELKTYRAGQTELVLERTDDTLEVRGRDASLSMRLVPGEYPNWRALLVDNPLEGRGAFTAHALGKLAKVSLGHKPTKRDPHYLPMQFAFHGRKAARVELEVDGIVFRGLAMPSTAPTTDELGDIELVEAPVETADGTTHFPNGTVDHVGAASGTVAS